MALHHVPWHNTSHYIASNDVTITWPDPQQTSRHQNTSLQSTKHHHHGTAEGSFTAKKWFGHRAGRSPCAHSIGKFFLCYIVLFLWKLPPPLVRALLVNIHQTYSCLQCLRLISTKAGHVSRSENILKQKCFGFSRAQKTKWHCEAKI